MRIIAMNVSTAKVTLKYEAHKSRIKKLIQSFRPLKKIHSAKLVDGITIKVIMDSDFTIDMLQNHLEQQAIMVDKVELQSICKLLNK